MRTATRAAACAAAALALTVAASPAYADAGTGSDPDVSADCTASVAVRSDGSTLRVVVAGYASYTGPKVAVATELYCAVVRNGTEWDRVHAAYPGPGAAVADVVTMPFGEVGVCAYANVLFSDGSESNPSGEVSCR